MQRAITLLTLALLFAASLYPQAPLGQGQVLILAGPPGSGKTLQATRLSRKYKIPSISTASVLNDSLQRHGSVPAHLKPSVAAGELLDDRAAIDLIGARINKPDAAHGFILDGYPSTEAQAKFLDQFLIAHKLGRPIVIVLRAPEAVLRERLRKRNRADDTPENIDRRLRELYREQELLERWYESQNMVAVDATAAPDPVFARVEAGIEEIYSRRALKTR